MTIKDLLVHVDQSPAAEARLEAALALAARFDAHLTALCLVAEPFLRGGAAHHLPEDIVREHLAHAEAEADATIAAARELAGRRGVELATRREAGPLDRLPTMLARHARHADLTIVGQPNPDLGGVDDALLAEAAFMDTGRPALVVPHGAAPTLPPRRALIARDGTRETARATSDAIPLLRQAEGVLLLVIDDGHGREVGGRPGVPPGAEIAAHLARHGIGTEPRAIRGGGRAAAETILAEAGDAGADLVVMGGYGHSRLREMMLGGATRHMLERMTVPVLFAH